MKSPSLRMIAWEVTRQCNLSCMHCRASAETGPYEGELSSPEAFGLLENIASFARPVVILTGGEPLLRNDIIEITRHGTALGLRMVMAPNGTLLTTPMAGELMAAGIQRISVSIDGSTADRHDAFRGMEGAYEGALRGIRSAKEVGLPFQINTTVTRKNVKDLPELLGLSLRLGAVAHHLFLLVPTGRGKEMASDAIPSDEYERVLNWLYDQREQASIQLKATCAPHFYRILRQRAKKEGKTVSYQHFGLDATTRGCLAGTAFCFISHQGDLQPCGYLDVSCGNVREKPLSVLWDTAEVFLQLREIDMYKGKCGRCEYRNVCGGCRARAFESTGDYLEEEPFCAYEPKRGIR